jgi:hypothetical protein
MPDPGGCTIVNLKHHYGGTIVTQHILAEHTEEDITTMRNLRNFVGGFMLFSIVMALGVVIFTP